MTSGVWVFKTPLGVLKVWKVCSEGSSSYSCRSPILALAPKRLSPIAGQTDVPTIGTGVPFAIVRFSCLLKSSKYSFDDKTVCPAPSFVNNVISAISSRSARI